MSITLPENATEASHRRAELAERLLQICPPSLAEEIALVGSTARGLADEDSDLELNLWAEAIPALDARLEWLQAAGASSLSVEGAPRGDNSHWIGCRLERIPVEVGWQTFDDLEAALASIREATMSEPNVSKTLDVRERKVSKIFNPKETKVPFFAELMASAIPLRTQGRLQAWQQTLAGLMDGMQQQAIRAAVERWSQAGERAARRRIAQRGERLALTEMLLGDLDMALRVLYAIHRRWQPSAKWTLTVARVFAPFDLDARIDAILSDPALERRVELCSRLCLDVLALVPEEYDVSAAVKCLRGTAESE